MPIKPVRDNLYIIPIEDNIVTNSGIILHEKAKQYVDHGIVKYKGPDVREIKVGDHVIFSGYAGTRMAVSDEGTLIILEEQFIDALWVKGTPSRVFTEIQILDWIEKAADGLALRNYAPSTVNLISEQLKSFVTASFEADSLLY